MAHPHPRRHHSLADQAALDALVRYGPEMSGLKELIRQARSDRHTSIHQAHGTATLLTQAIGQAAPAVASIYDNAGLTQARAAHTLVSQDLAGLGPAADPFKAASATEQANLTGLMAGAQADALTGLQQQKVAAREGEGYAVKSAQSQFASTVAKVLQRSLDLANERGAFTASDLYKLRQDKQAAKQALDIATGRTTQQERDSMRSAGIDPNTGKPIANGPLDPNSPANRERNRGNRGPGSRGGPTSSQLAASSSSVSDMRTYAVKWKRSGLTRGQVASKLQSGRPQQRVQIGVNADGSKRYAELPKVPSYKADVFMKAALDQAFDGHLWRQTEHRLRQLGYNPKRLGLTSYEDWSRRASTQGPRAGLPNG